MEKQQNIAQAQEKFVIHLDANIAKIVLPFDRKELAAAYLQLFSGFAWVNWTNKHSLGRAWQTALEQCGAFAETKNKKNPAAKYLNNVYSAHKKYWSRVIMTHGERDNTINPEEPKIKQLRAHGEKMIREAMDKINLILARYNERTEELIATQAKEKTQMHATAQAQEQAKMAMPEQAKQQNAKSVAAPAQQSGAFAMVRDAVKKPATVVADKPVDTPTAVAKPAEVKPIEKKQEQPQVKTKVAQEKKPIVHHMAKPVAAPVKKSGALPAVRDNVKQPNIVKSEEKVKEFQAGQQRLEISAEQRAQMQLKFQQQIQMWQIGQYRQNAA
ncbi:MAG: hypothetical protein ACLRFO_00825 [Alphaproteobacteria bacterium]